MSRRHTSFLLRCWHVDSDQERIEIEHIQSGTKTLARSVVAAVEWICHYNAGVVTQQGEAERAKNNHK